MKTLTVNLNKHSYNIYIGENTLYYCGEYIRKSYNGSVCAVISDENVWALYGDKLTASLEKAGLTVYTIVLPSGEGSKSIESYSKVLCSLADYGITRSDLLIAFGGGVMGDLGGFCAASYMRGIPFVQIPTTLLSQVDSSVGGKTAINLPNGKNLVGAFYQPKAVLIDTLLLNSLNDREFAAGMAEVIKYGVLFSEEFFTVLQAAKNRSGAMKIIDEIIYKCCDYKRQVVERDEFDNGERMLLNLGHTFGHSIEKLGDFKKYIHGEAVAIGMVNAAAYSEMLGMAKPGCAKAVYEICLGYGLPVSEKISAVQMAEYFSLDKKASGKSISLILIKAIGKGISFNQTVNELCGNMPRLDKYIAESGWQ